MVIYDTGRPWSPVRADTRKPRLELERRGLLLRVRTGCSSPCAAITAKGLPRAAAKPPPSTGGGCLVAVHRVDQRLGIAPELVQGIQDFPVIRRVNELNHESFQYQVLFTGNNRNIYKPFSAAG